jgi:indolepyruvate ferredoxin oxidoreductase beta subunit
VSAIQVGRSRACRVLIGTVGGQGGGVLSDWLVHGMLESGWGATSIGLLGLSQRAGTVTYYCEGAPGRGVQRVTSMFAAPGEVDLVIGQELLELGRMLAAGFAAPHAVIIGNSSRYLTTAEKMPAEGGIYDTSIIVEAARQLAPERHYLFDAQRLVVEAGLPPLSSNAILLGAAVASPVLNLAREGFHAAIRRSEVNVKANIAAFDLGYDRVRDGTLPRMMVSGVKLPQKADEIARQRLSAIEGPDAQFAYRKLVDRCAGELPAEVMTVLAEALYRLIDFQDVRYAEDYIGRLNTMAARGLAAQKLLAVYARHLANWLTYEDASRVAQLKTRRRRFAGIEEEYGLNGQRYVVVDYLVPDTEQVLGGLPAGLARFIESIGRRLFRNFDRLKFPLRIKTSTVVGYWLMRMIAAQRRFRRGSLRHGQELLLIARWEAAIAQQLDHPDFAELAADAARVVKGYGRTRRDALDDLWSFLSQGFERLAKIAAAGGDVKAAGTQALATLSREAGSAAACLKVLDASLVALEKRAASVTVN